MDNGFSGSMPGCLSPLAAALLAAILATGCASAPPTKTAVDWQPLFDGRSTHGWRNVGKTTLDPRWQVVDDALVLTAAGGGDIVSVGTFADFELELEWRLAPGGNSGLFYRAIDAEPVWARAVEFQLLDDQRAEDRFIASHRAGAAYDLVVPEGASLRPADEYNLARVVACGARVEHWLNGVRVAAYDLDSDDWRRRVAASKFARQADFATARRGHIGLQDHGDVMSVRNIRVRALGADCAPAR